MDCELKEIESKQTWEDFLAGIQPPSFLHSWNWGRFNQRMGDRIFRFGIYADGILNGVTLLIRVRAKRGSFLLCPHGPILKNEFDHKSALEAVVKKLRQLAEQENCSFARVCPLMSDNEENRKLFDGLGAKEAPTHTHPELTWVLDITPSEQELIKNMRKATRYSIRKAESSGVEVQISRDPQDIARFNALYLATVSRQHFTPFPENYLETEFRTFLEDDQAALIFGRYNNEDISGALIIYYNGAGYYHHGASNQKHPQIPASYLVQWRAIQEAKRRGFHDYNFYGIAPDNQPKHPWAGLSLFKKGFGGRAESYVHAKDFVFSQRYWLTYVIERIRKAKRHL